MHRRRGIRARTPHGQALEETHNVIGCLADQAARERYAPHFRQRPGGARKPATQQI
jgi:hypothetical protein